MVVRLTAELFFKLGLLQWNSNSQFGLDIIICIWPQVNYGCHLPSPIKLSKGHVSEPVVVSKKLIGHRCWLPFLLLFDDYRFWACFRESIYVKLRASGLIKCLACLLLRLVASSNGQTSNTRSYGSSLRAGRRNDPLCWRKGSCG
eukprot:scaffold9965_cov128-Cylindrotheca_fusiformis.AAC.1